MMRITITALGTRGDVQPMIALGKTIQKPGVEVRLIAGSNFEGWIKGHGLGFVPSLDMESLMNSDKGQTWSESSNNPLQEVQVMRALLHEHAHRMYLPMQECAPDTDFWIAGFTSEAYVQAVTEATGKGYLNAMLQPQYPTVSGEASVTPLVPTRNNPLNRLMGKFVERVLWSILKETTNTFRTSHLGLPPHTFGSYQKARRKAHTLFGFSPKVVPNAPDWDRICHICGYWFLDEAQQDSPSAELSAFLEAGDAPVYIGFGSMSHRDPQHTLNLILEALKHTRQRAVVASGWNSADLQVRSDQVLLVSSVSHNWLFPRVSAVVHHGGAGTTAAGLRAGKPTLIIPHMSDQPYWGRRVHELGVGAAPIPRHKLNVARLAAAITQITTDPAMRQRAEALGRHIRAEDGLKNTSDLIQQLSS